VVKTASRSRGNLSALKKSYKYQTELTRRLDKIKSRQFSQPLINEIVLWKTNRYAEPSGQTMRALNRLKHVKRGEHRKAKVAIELLLCESGVDLPMASTILRFRNPNAFQIIDRHAYRAVYGKKYTLTTKTRLQTKIDTYFQYLDDLIVISKRKGVDYKLLDRVLYVFDKKHNEKL
jgi:thermostable 8-oxoguanine DNA glycosylase